MSELTKALISFHQGVGSIVKNARADRYVYADLATVLAAIREPLAAAGLAVTQTFEGGELVTTLLHVGGESITSRMVLPVLESRGMNACQAFGSAISYCRRYALLALLSLASEDDDAASTSEPSDAPRSPGKASRGEGVPF